MRNAQWKEETSVKSRKRCGVSGIAGIELESVYRSLAKCEYKLPDRKKEAMFVVQAWGVPGLCREHSKSERRKNRLVDSSLTLLEFGRRNGGTPWSGTFQTLGRSNLALPLGSREWPRQSRRMQKSQELRVGLCVW